MLRYEVWDGSVGIFEDAKNHLLYQVMQLRSRTLESSMTISTAAKAALISTQSDKGITASMSASTFEIPEDEPGGGETITKHSLSIG